jgi:hypothetical protein
MNNPNNMGTHFEKWNPGTGKHWLQIWTDDSTIGLTVEESRKLALEIINRAWKAEKVSELIEVLRKAENCNIAAGWML